MAFDDLKTIRLVQTGAVLRLSLNRPDKLNSFTGQMHAELREVLDALQQGQGDLAQVRVLVLAAEGKGFCAGQDLADPAHHLLVLGDTSPVPTYERKTVW
jgi:2-(1,2-epoxy-1,2-dihydrophenyl)acetyl-CoA isomerase